MIKQTRSVQWHCSAGCRAQQGYLLLLADVAQQQMRLQAASMHQLRHSASNPRAIESLHNLACQISVRQMASSSCYLSSHTDRGLQTLSASYTFCELVPIQPHGPCMGARLLTSKKVSSTAAWCIDACAVLVASLAVKVGTTCVTMPQYTTMHC